MTGTTIFADLHIHIGRTNSNLPVKITAARSMTFDKIVRESYHRKGIQMIGIIDAHSPPVQDDIRDGIATGVFREHPDGGIVYQDTTCILGAEIEVREGRGACHVLVYMPTLSQMTLLSKWLAKHMKNVQLSTQRLYQPISALQEKVAELEGMMIPAHVFTPFKSVYGSAADRMRDLFDIDQLAGVELGLSSDSSLADRLSELQHLTFVTNSDAHSIPKIGREYNQLLVKEASFQEFKLALQREQGRKVIANYGLNPRLGKYYRTRCLNCEELWPSDQSDRCPYCGSVKKVKGVRDRISELADQKMEHPSHRPPYIHQVPLEYIPKLGKKTLEKLLAHFGTEMDILHHAEIEDIAKIASPSIAEHIRLARVGNLEFEEGGGGTYGKVKPS
ncbi:endonuclease Q family protein [Thermoflavimicrobium daqui]|uniref:TIGR00375 family protein n=1 Tax=Thermoflavimicrobium daqui TaxID=2137476 RepID=A0A364K8B7_9BACL|nr:endonuclease Q family protein [Thermoflavimicrobium daqui]RAL26534.1 TIGR00375 family protein [Thermoflavimicrobium daqui]